MRAGPVTLGLGSTALLLLATAMPAAADGIQPNGQASGVINQSGNPTAIASERDERPAQSHGGEGASTLTCTWHVWIADDTEFPVYETEGVELHSETGRWLEEQCRDSATGALISRIVPENRVDPAAVAAQALQSVSIPDPVIQTNPSRSSGLYVRVPTWLWIDPGWWRSYSATATAGAVTASVEARPVRVSWTTGDGSTVDCAGPGTAWQSGLPEEATDCSHAYTSSSDVEPEGTFRLTATVELVVTWTSNVGVSGELGPIHRSSTEPVRVGEIQAIETE